MQKAYIITATGRKERIDISKLQKIDDGGESIVYDYEVNTVMKLFTASGKDLAKKVASFDAYMKHHSSLFNGLGNVATIPRQLVVDDAIIFPTTVGYTMEKCDNWWNLYDLIDSDFRKQHGIGFLDMTLIFLEIHRAIKLIHGRGFIIGDLNIRNILIKPKRPSDQDPYFEVKIIDTDSWGIENPDLRLSFQPSAIDNSIMHPHRRKARDENKTPPPFMQREDWWSFALLLSHCLLSFDPFFVGTTKNDAGRDDRAVSGLTVWLGKVKTSRSQAIAAVRIGSKMHILLHRWLKCTTEGEFPADALLEFYEGIVRCRGKDLRGQDCLLQFHRSTRFCPNCGTIAS